MIYAPKIDCPETYFIFRDSGWEVEFTIKGQSIHCSKKLHPNEVAFIKEKLIKKQLCLPQKN